MRRLSAEPLEDRSLLAVDLVGYYLNVVEDAAVPGSGINVGWGVWNPGNSSSGGFYVHFYLVNSNNVVSFRGTEFISGLSANGGSFSAQTALSLPQSNDAFWTGSGSYKLAMYVDYYNNVGESNEGNNYNYSYLQDYDYLYVNVLPDLVASNISVVGGTNAKPGDSLNISFDVQNQASAAAGSFQARVYLSTNEVISTFDYLLGSIDLVFGLGANSSTGVGFYGTPLPGASDAFWSSVGSQSTFYVGVVLDPLNQVAESNEFNNDNRGLGVDVAQITLAPRPDLRGTQFSVDNPTALQSGGQGSFSYQAMNVGGAVAPQTNAGLFLSRDANITTADRFLRSVTISSLGSLDTQSGSNMLFQLPDGNDAFWDGASGETFYLGLIYDYDGAVSETNETNNANLGLGIDAAQVTINRKIDLTKLDPTGFVPGELSRVFLEELRAYLLDVKKDLALIRSAVGRDPTILDLQGKLNSLISEVRYFESIVKRIGNGTMRPIDLGNGISFDSAQVELAERGILYLVSRVRASSSSTAFNDQSFDDAAVATTDAVDKPTLEQATQWLREAIRDSRLPEVIIAGGTIIFVGAGATANVPVAMFGLGAITAGVTLRRWANGAKKNDVAQNEQVKGYSRQVVEANAFGSAAAGISVITGIGGRLKNALDDASTFFASIGRAAENTPNYAGAVRNAAFAGRWNGNNFDPGGANKMTVNFNRNGGATPSGSVQFISRTFQGGSLIKTERMTGTFSGRWTTDNKIEGNITIRNSRGQTVTLPFSWNYDGNSLSGSLFDGSGNFSVTK